MTWIPASSLRKEWHDKVYELWKIWFFLYMIVDVQLVSVGEIVWKANVGFFVHVDFCRLSYQKSR
jgi:hypothetical protein